MGRLDLSSITSQAATGRSKLRTIVDLLGTINLQVLVAVAAILLHFRFDRTLFKIFGNCLTGVCLRLGIVKDEMDEAPARPHPDCPSAADQTADQISERSKYIPVRLFHDERKYLRLIRSTLKVSSYTDKVDSVFADEAKHVRTKTTEIMAALSSLAIATNYEIGQRLIEEGNFSEYADYFAAVLEVGRRYKIMNPEKMRDAYGKLIYMLQDVSSPQVQEILECACLKPIKSVYTTLVEARAEGMLSEPDIAIATGEIVTGRRQRYVVDRDIKAKESAIEKLSKKYKSSKIDQEQLRQCLYSIGDNNSYLAQFRTPVDKMIVLLAAHFTPDTAEDGFELGISEGDGGARLSHRHADQYNYVLQSLMLWREIMHDMYKMWYLAEEDLLDPASPYELTNTGQGLQRMQACPRIRKAVEDVLGLVKEKVEWVGDQTIHLGDTNVPNALIFIDKYNQVPRILNPIILTLEYIDTTLVKDPELLVYVEETFGGPSNLAKTILTDFFRCGFDGSGADNFFEAGSCIDGRLTSAWNWCSQLDKKPFYPIFKLAGFTGFDGDFED